MKASNFDSYLNLLRSPGGVSITTLEVCPSGVVVIRNAFKIGHSDPSDRGKARVNI